MIHGISHLTFIVQNLDQMERLLTTVFKAQKVYDSGEKSFSHSKERFFLIGDVWIAIMEGSALSSQTYNHVAFKIDDADYEHYLTTLSSLGVQVLPDRPRIDGEARSIYFYDYDNHMFELHTGTLNERLSSYEEENKLCT
jgi:catechol 2,3-dioxygenase-like lactoylglutathione lyase family enzyme